MICGDRIGHNGGRIGVDQGDRDTLLAERAGRLGSRIIKFTSLSYDYRAATDDKYMFDAIVFRHSLEVCAIKILMAKLGQN